MIKRRILGTDANIKYKFPWNEKNSEETEEDAIRKKKIKMLKNIKKEKLQHCV